MFAYLVGMVLLTFRFTGNFKIRLDNYYKGFLWENEFCTTNVPAGAPVLGLQQMNSKFLQSLQISLQLLKMEGTTTYNFVG